MKIIPAVDIQRGKCVRLARGDFAREEVFYENPVGAALKWEREGAELLHVIDLDGARTGVQLNAGAIMQIARKSAIPIQVGGGIRTAETARSLLNAGIFRVILGTAAVQQPELIKELSREFGSARVAVSIDVKFGSVAVEGWRKTAVQSPLWIAENAVGLGAGVIFVTGIARDGMLEGADLKLAEEFAGKLSVPVIYAGGVSSLNDLRELRGVGVWGAVVGKALYTKRFTFKEGVECLQNE